MMACNDIKEKLKDEVADALIKSKTVSRSIHISHFKIDQEMRNKIYKRFPNIPQRYGTGSLHEGMNVDVAGDKDIMYTCREFPIVLFDSVVSTDQHTCGYVKAEHNPDDPVYLKLKVVNKDSLHVNVRYNMIDKDGYLNTEKFLEFVRNEIPVKKEIHGPSFTYTENRTLYSHDYNIAPKHDIVYSLKGNSWPSITTRISTRQRNGHWPSQELLNSVSRLECLVVAVGHPDRSKVNTEWRLSFSLAEKELIHNMSEPYFNCMYALKAIKNKYILYSKYDKPTPFCSYYLKTACLWMCETYPVEGHSIIDLIRKTIDWLIDCYQCKNLPHYFIPEQNLIGSLSPECCDDVITKLKAVKNDLWRKVVTSVFIPANTSDFAIHTMRKSKFKINNTEANVCDLETILMNNTKSTEQLKYFMKSLMPGGSIYECQGSLATVFFLNGSGNVLSNVLQDVPENKFTKKFIYHLLEEITLEIINDLARIIPDVHIELFKRILYKNLGETYTVLLTLLCRAGVILPSQSVYWGKALHYYELAAEIQHPERWRDCTTACHVSIIVHHYLTDNYRKLKEKLATMIPKLLHIKKDLHWAIRQIYQVEFDNDAWHIDGVLNILLERETEILFNSVVLAFYVNARVCLREGDIDNAHVMVKEMEKCLIGYDVVIYSTNFLIQIIKSLIGLLGVARLIHKNLI